MTSNLLKGIEPEILWQRFYEITRVPRPSKKERKIVEHMKSFFNQLNIPFKEDEVGNLVASVPASKGYENAPTVVLQGHVDMVCEKNKNKNFDFENDPIELIRDGDWIKADGTTLGSDNGIGVAAALAVITDEQVIHGPIEILLTVDEETGLTGANNLKPGFISGKILINMDSEEDGAFYIGCSGGVDTIAEFKTLYRNLPENNIPYKLNITGLKGGHSGLDINTGRGNAIKILARVMKKLEGLNFLLSEIEGGSLRNAIPREAEAILFMEGNKYDEARSVIDQFRDQISNEFKSSDPDVKISLEETKSDSGKVFPDEFTRKITDSLLAVPNGVIAMSQDIEGLVETSTNLATVNITDGILKIGTSQRSSVDSAKEYIAQSVAAVFRLAGADVSHSDGYPGWKPNLDSNLLKISQTVFKNLFNKEPELKAIHAGLECGILEGKNPGLDMVSFGPTILGAHSPDERVSISTVGRFYQLLKGILKEIAESSKN
ncbi:MAG: aminoacyl-histidine dipeptidase [Ignavibacteriaceae bacterium]